MNLQQAFDAGFEAVKAYVDSELSDFEKRLGAVEKREPARGENGKDGVNGRDGKDADVERIASLEHEIVELKRFVTELIAREPLKGEKGDPGQDGKAGPAGSSGAPGRDGIDGKDGAPGERGLPGEPGLDGKDGAAGRDGRDGLPGVPGKDGLNGKDGRDGIDGKDGAAGLDGKDGLGFDDMTAELEDDGRVLCLRWVRGDQRKEVRLTTGFSIYRGVFQDGQTYERGDLVTWGGSVWHCNAETPDKPGDGSKTWTLAVKKGRDGRDGKDGEKGERGVAGKDGRSAY